MVGRLPNTEVEESNATGTRSPLAATFIATYSIVRLVCLNHLVRLRQVLANDDLVDDGYENTYSLG